MTYNGEIYNHLAFRSEIPEDYYRFKGSSDTETLIVAIEYLGISKVLEICDGMFALAIYDRKEESLHLIRDFAGIKPLFYGFRDGVIVFASQYDQVLAHPAFRQEPIRSDVLHLYLSQHYLPPPLGLHENTFQVCPGQWLTFDKTGKKESREYWTFPSLPEVFEIKDSSLALEFLEEELQDSVQAELLSDVPLGAFLSGGIDSPLVCYFANRNLKEKLSTFTIGSDSITHDESAYARIYADSIGVDFHLEQMDHRAAYDVLEEVSSCFHEPIGDFSLIPTFLVSKLARKKATVALSGDGGDELFFGYERFWSLEKNRTIQTWPFLIKYLIYGVDKAFFNKRHVNSAALEQKTSIAHQGLHSRFQEQWIEQLSSNLAREPFPKEFKTYNYPQVKDQISLLHLIRKAEFYGMMQKTLRKVDLASMQNSLEVRVPFLKKSMIEAAIKLNPLFSFGPGKKKELLKDLLRKRIPKAPIDDVKRGFSVPLNKWLKQDLFPIFQEVLMDNSTLQYFDFKPGGMEGLLRAHLNGSDRKWPLFTLYSLFRWQVAQKG